MNIIVLPSEDLLTGARFSLVDTEFSWLGTLATAKTKNKVLQGI